METALQKLNIDKSNWKLVKLGDVVAEPKEIAKNLQEEEIDKVVGLEHIDSEDVHLRRFAGLESSTTFTKKFREGDILFGRRRAYLKKAAQAPFSGICSGDITVMRAKKGILPELLPFVICNDKFFDYAVKHSAGGLSPRVKFKDLANYEFLLPSKEQQAQLADLLWAMDELNEKEQLLFSKFIQYKEVKLEQLLKGINGNDILHKTDYSNKYCLMGIDEFLIKKKAAMKMGPFGSSLKKEYFVNTGVRFKVYGQENVFKNNMFEGNRYINKERFIKLKSCEIFPGDFLITVMGTIGKTMVVPQNFERGIMDSHLIRLQIDERIVSPQIIGLQFSISHILDQIRRLAVGGIMDGLSSGAIKKLKFIVPPKEEQETILNTLNTFIKTEEKLQNKITSSKALQRSLINQIF